MESEMHFEKAPGQEKFENLIGNIFVLQKRQRFLYIYIYCFVCVNFNSECFL